MARSRISLIRVTSKGLDGNLYGETSDLISRIPHADAVIVHRVSSTTVSLAIEVTQTLEGQAEI